MISFAISFFHSNDHKGLGKAASFSEACWAQSNVFRLYSTSPYQMWRTGVLRFGYSVPALEQHLAHGFPQGAVVEGIKYAISSQLSSTEVVPIPVFRFPWLRAVAFTLNFRGKEKDEGYLNAKQFFEFHVR
jgi:hypothetical protein